MNPQTSGLRVAATVFAIAGLLQLVRLLLGWEVSINHREIPLGLSGAAAVTLAGLSLWLFRLARARA